MQITFQEVAQTYGCALFIITLGAALYVAIRNHTRREADRLDRADSAAAARDMGR